MTDCHIAFSSHALPTVCSASPVAGVSSHAAKCSPRSCRTAIVFRLYHVPNRGHVMRLRGSLTKIAYYSTVSHKRAVYNADFQKNGSCSGGGEREAGVPESRDGVPWEREVETGRLHFVKFETRHIEAWLRFVQEELLRDGSPPSLGGSVKLTGGGAFRHRQLIATTLGLRQVVRPRAMILFSASTVAGPHFK
ncbi:hypothetical protein HPB50_025967 [Hyalomma asiaticum]|uniref:Uncharacterized protein n=1 Tax=Hyalomma asiaticum TaxID=266040 RepID=A0ACB7T2D2_HYAAI|nr:hypothetical protein HPB50_025967 [Hyalomma asiaticum]